MKLLNALFFCFFFLVGSSNVFSATHNSISEIKPTGFKNETRFRNLSITAKSELHIKKMSLKERLLILILKNKLKRFRKDSTSKEIEVAGNSGLGLGIGSLAGYLLVERFLFINVIIGSGSGILLFLLALLGLGLSIYSLILGSKYVRKSMKEPEKYLKGRGTTAKVLGIIGIVLWSILLLSIPL